MPLPVSTMDRRRSSSERTGAGGAGGSGGVINGTPTVDLVAIASGGSFNVYSHSVAGTTGTPSIRVSGSMSRIQSARSSTASYCPALGGTVYSGDVPPLHRRSFLGPDGTRIVQPADSNDNIAQLIPR